MNKFLNRNVRPSDRKKKPVGFNRQKALDVINECSRYWYSLYTVREKMKRSIMYAMEDQWGDLVKDPDTGNMITESDLIKKQGRVPLKNNVISPIVKNIDGQFRSSISQPVCSVRDPSEQKIGEMMTLAMEYVRSINSITELDANCLKIMEAGGVAAQRIEYGWNVAKGMNDVWVYECDPNRLFFNTNIEDVRGWDITCIGELYDMPKDKVKSLFAKTEEDREWIDSIYRTSDTYLAYDGMQGREIKDLDFFMPSREDLCRVILCWRLEMREAYFYHDTLKGTWGYVGKYEKYILDTENKKRMDDATAHGVLPEDVLLIDYESSYEQYWYFRYMSPEGYILQEGRSPFWHKSHNFAIKLYPLINGKIYNFIEDFIDQQRSINRTMTLIDFIRSSSAKGLLIADESAFESMSRDELIDEYVRYNGVLFCRLKPGQNINNVIAQYNGSAAVAGDYELLNIQLKLINDISGVNSAMQGQAAKSGTAASLYAQQTQNASMNIKGLLDAFNSFRKDRDVKVMKTVQQYYKKSHHIAISGKNYSSEASYYDAEKVQNAEIDLELSENSSTPGMQYVANEFLMNLFDKNAIDITTLLENTTYPFAKNVLESIKRNRVAMENGQPMPGVPMPQSSGLLAQALNNNNAVLQQ